MVEMVMSKGQTFKMHCTIERIGSEGMRLTVYPDLNNMEIKIIHEYPNEETMEKYIDKALRERDINVEG